MAGLVGANGAVVGMAPAVTLGASWLVSDSPALEDDQNTALPLSMNVRAWQKGFVLSSMHA